MRLVGLCRGEYIALVEADGVAAPDCFARQLAGVGRFGGATGQSGNAPLVRTLEGFNRDMPEKGS